MSNPAYSKSAKFQTPAKPKQPDRRIRASKTKAERLMHAPSRSDRNAIMTCRQYFLSLRVPVTSSSPLADSWHEIIARIRPDRRDASLLVLGILVARQIAPADLTAARLEALIGEVEHHHRATFLAETAAKSTDHTVQRSIRCVFAQFVTGLVQLRLLDPNFELFQDFQILKSFSEKKNETRHSISRSTRRIIDKIMQSVYASRLKSRPKSRYKYLLIELAAILESKGLKITRIDDCWTKIAIDILCEAWEREAIPPQQSLSFLHVLRWVAKHHRLDLDAIFAIQNLAKGYRSRQKGSAAPKDLAIVARYGANKEFCILLGNLLALAGGKDGKGQPREQIARASGACLCLLQLISGVRVAQLDLLAITHEANDHSPTLLPVVGAPSKSTLRVGSLSPAINTDEFNRALRAFCALFVGFYGRKPTSLLDGLDGERDHHGSAQARMQIVLADIAPGMTPGMLRDLLVWRLLDDHDATRISRILGYTSYRRFLDKYEPLIALASSKTLVR